MTRVIFVVVVLALAVTSRADTPSAVPQSPLTPDAEKATFRLAPGLRIDLVASEPQIESPVHCAFDEHGRLWVVEMRDYPNGPSAGKPPEGRVKLLTDTDGDGRYETATVFADGLLFANGVLPWGNGAIVTAAPHILYLADTNGDGKADVREILYEGFVAGNPQLRVSHPALGPDSWVYVANGLRGGEVRRAGKPNTPALSIGGKDFRFDPVRDRAEAIPGLGQFGNTFDRWGNRFVCDNRHHLRHIVFPTDPATRNPLLVARPLVEDTAGPADGPLSSGTKLYPLSRNWTTSNLHAGRFTAACGVFAEQGGLLPEPYRDGVFTCDPTGNLVHMEKLEPAGATFRSRTWKEGVEFLASPDEWFRPVSLAQAPDGSVLLVDMYRAVIEHPEFMPVELKNRPDLMLGKERGRIWRIAPEGNVSRTANVTLATAKTPEWVQLLGHANGWHRTTAQRLLLTSADPGIPELLTKYAAETASPEGLIRAAWLLAEKGSATDVPVRMMTHHHPRVREHAARLLENIDPSRLAGLATDADARVRFQAALSLGAWDDDSVVAPLARIAAQDAVDPWTRWAVTASAGKRTAAVVTALFSNGDFTRTPDPGRLALVQELCDGVGAGRDPAQAGIIVAALADREARWLRAGLTGLTDGLARRGTAFPTFLDKLPDPAKARGLLATATKPAADSKAGDGERTAAVHLLAHAPWDTASPVLAQLMVFEGTPLVVRVAAVRALAAHPRPEVAGLLLAGWHGYTPAVRAETLDGLLRRPDRVAALLDAVESGRVRPGDIDPTRARRILAMKTVAGRALKLLQTSLPADRKEALASFRPALTMAADALRGKAVFQKTCSACHSIAGVGTQVGPDISDTRTKTPEMLLTDILNPNAAVDGNYLAYTVTTKDGKVLTGMIAAESAAGITLKRENAQTESVQRADVDEVKSSGVSLMPDGLEKGLTVQDVADLIRFLKDWRYLDGATPRAK